MKKCKNRLFISLVAVLFIVNCIALASMGRTIKGMGNLISILENKIEIHEIQRRADIADLYRSLTVLAKAYTFNVKSYRILVKKIEDLVKEIDKGLKNKKDIDLAEYTRVKEASVKIMNFTRGCSGSGTHIEYKGKKYILTVAHLSNYDPNDEKSESESLYVRLDDGSLYPMKLEKVDKSKDLALYTVNFGREIATLELGTELPKEGSEVYVVGCPDGMIDVVTDGVIADISKMHYTITNKIYFGNSGGALLYRGKLVGVASQLAIYMNFPSVFVNYGKFIKLERIIEFLEYLK